MIGHGDECAHICAYFFSSRVLGKLAEFIDPETKEDVVGGKRITSGTRTMILMESVEMVQRHDPSHGQRFGTLLGEQ